MPREDIDINENGKRVKGFVQSLSGKITVKVE